MNINVKENTLWDQVNMYVYEHVFSSEHFMREFVNTICANAACVNNSTIREHDHVFANRVRGSINL